MGNFCEDVRALIGEQLRAIGATCIGDARSGSGLDNKEVCYFSASGKIVAISYSPRDGISCHVGDAEAAELAQYETWDPLWHLLGMDENLDTLEGLAAYIDSFPKGHAEGIAYVGDCLVEYFGGMKRCDES